MKKEKTRKLPDSPHLSLWSWLNFENKGFFSGVCVSYDSWKSSGPEHKCTFCRSRHTWWNHAEPTISIIFWQQSSTDISFAVCCSSCFVDMWQNKFYLPSAATRATAKETSPPKKGEQANNQLIGNYNSLKNIFLPDRNWRAGFKQGGWTNRAVDSATV